MTLADAFAVLARDGRVARAAWPSDQPLADVGLIAEGDWVVPAGRFDPLAADAIRGHLEGSCQDWLQRLDIHPMIGSTNVELMTRAGSESVDGHACLAEVQVQGRGRRGRGWFSPFGANLAVSIGMAVSRPPAELGGVSLVVGLAVADVLDRLEVPDVMLKWPNDVLLGGAKLAGILIELTQTQAPTRGTELVIGIGVNVAVPEAIQARLERRVADLSGYPQILRSALAGRLISRVRDFVAGFALQGFEPFRPAFDSRHYYQGRDCEVLLGDKRIAGVVQGVSATGELLLETAAGAQAFNGGEVSLRGPAAD